MAEVVFARWQYAYYAKAMGGQDEFGNSWEPLAESTLKKKKPSGTDWKRVWSDKQHQIISHLVRSGMSLKDAKGKAASMLWGSPDQGIPINIDSSRLVSSLDPNGHEDQIREETGDSLYLGTGTPYAHYVDAKRRFLPTAEEASQWVKLAVDVIRNEIADNVKSKAG